MPLAQHLGELSLLLVILLGPFPFCLSALLLAQNENNAISCSHALLLILTCWCVIENSLGLFLGIFQQLHLQATIVAELLIFGIGLIAFSYLKRRHPDKFQRNPLISLPKLSTLEKLIMTIMTVVGFTLYWQLMVEPITNYDSLAYHLPVMAKWYQTSSLAIIPELDQIARYPYNWENLCTLFMLPFREDLGIAWPNLAAWMMFGLAIYRVSQEAGAARVQAMAMTVLALTLPSVTQTVNTMHIDLPMAAFIVCGFYWVLSFHHTRSLVSLALLLATLGILAGIKTSAPFYGFLLIIALIGLEAKTIFHRPMLANMVISRAPFSITLIAVALFASLFLGGFWYVRNFIDLGNPLGFVKVQLGEQLLFPGKIDFSFFHQTTLANLFDLTSFSNWKILIGEIKLQLNLPFLAILLQAPFGFMAFAAGKNRVKKAYLLALLGLIIGAGYLYWHTPYSGDNGTHQWQITPWISLGFRYAFPLLGFLTVAAAIGATNIRARNESLAAIVIIGGMLALAGTMMRYAIIVVLVFWGLIIEIGRANFNPTARRILKHLGYTVALSLFCIVTFNARQQRELQRGTAYRGIYDFLARQVGKEEKVGYLLSHQSYLFYGKNFDRQVLSVPAETESLSDWLNLLREKDVSIVAIGPLRADWRLRQEVVWLNDPEGPFVQVFGKRAGSGPALYRFKSSSHRAR